MAIYVNFEKPETIGEFLIKFFSYSCEASYVFKSVETYKDKECIELECGKDKFRSFDALLEIINTYYPDTTPKQLMHELLVLDIRKYDKRYYPYLIFCEDIDNITFCYYYEKHKYYQLFSDNYDKGIKQIHNIYTWRELLNMLDITNEEQLHSYIDNKGKIEEKIENEGIINEV